MELLLGQRLARLSDLAAMRQRGSRTALIDGEAVVSYADLANRVELRVAELGLDCEIRKVTAVAEIMKYGVMITPALVVDGEVKVVGKVPSCAEIKAMIG